MVLRDKHTAEGSQVRLVPTRSTQGRLGSKRRMAEKGNAAPDDKTYRSRDRERKNGSRLGNKEGTDGMPLVQKKGAFHE